MVRIWRFELGHIFFFTHCFLIRAVQTAWFVVYDFVIYMYDSVLTWFFLFTQTLQNHVWFLPRLTKENEGGYLHIIIIANAFLRKILKFSWIFQAASLFLFWKIKVNLDSKVHLEQKVSGTENSHLSTTCTMYRCYNVAPVFSLERH